MSSRLVIVGDGHLEKNLKTFSKEIGIEQNVVWAGFCDDIPNVMAAFDVFVLSSRFEGFGLVLIEAMTSKLPVIATKVDSIPEIVVDGKTGFCIEYWLPDEMANAMKMLTQKETREFLGNNGKCHVKENFSLDSMTNETAELYLSLAEMPQ